MYLEYVCGKILYDYVISVGSFLYRIKELLVYIVLNNYWYFF